MLMKKTEELTLRVIAVLSVALLSGCVAVDANIGTSEKDSEYLSPCEKHSTRDGNFFSETKFATWVRFKNVNRARVFNAAVAALRNQGFTSAIADRKAGTISGSQASRQEPVLIGVKSDNSDVIVAINVYRDFGLMGGAADEMCGIMADIEQQLKVQAKNSISVRPKRKAEPKNTRQKKKEALLGQQVVLSEKANTGDKPSAKTGRVHFVCVPKCYMRQAPDTNSPTVAELLQYDWVRVLKTKSSWCQVQTGAGAVGWMSQTMIE